VDRESVEEFVGDDKGSFVGFYSLLEGVLRVQASILPEGTKRMFSVQIMGRFAYLLMLRCPIEVSVIGASPQSSCFCASLKDGLASTKYTASILEAMGLKFRIVYITYQLPFRKICKHLLEAYT
jgi:hypothetical protein